MTETWYPGPTRSQEVVDQTHPGFTVVCRKCGSSLVYVECSLGSSDASGDWGSVDLVCDNCGERTELYDAG